MDKVDIYCTLKYKLRKINVYPYWDGGINSIFSCYSKSYNFLSYTWDEVSQVEIIDQINSNIK
jgi:hypothetical protein